MSRTAKRDPREDEWTTGPRLGIDEEVLGVFASNAPCRGIVNLLKGKRVEVESDAE